LTVTITIGFEQPPTENIGGAALTYGGIRVHVDGRELTKLEDEDGYRRQSENRPRYDSRGNVLDAEFHEFKGEFIAPIISKLLDTLIFVANQTDRFPEQTVQLTGTGGNLLVISYLDGEHVRFAFQKKYGGENYNHHPPLDNQIGYAVGFDELCQEVIVAAEEYLTFTEIAGHEGEQVETIEERVDTLRSRSSLNR
jgi:hypothetical protein